MSHPLAEGLRSGLAELQLDLSPAQQQCLLDYADWLLKWNRVYNLSALRQPQQVLTHHLLDSLAVCAPVQCQLAALGLAQPPRLLDVGSGGGLPGVVLAIADPALLVRCVDAVAKKALFISQVAAALRLPNLQGQHARVEQIEQPHDLVLSRAFASLADFTRLSQAALAPQGLWLALKGKWPHEEIAALPPEIEVFHVEPITVPGLDAERCLIWMRRRA
ncbi:predicted S-adenosylmethionine-dependent methyltransferase involved in bacterial cell division [Serpentinimonas raichei]|uniref:Ribosomal RNA small subunit methyltransferase G n=1 Tax=Serpentinimonas raichei TaxID=1458425 RepID=A0A060NK42_9BURK|nr:16S rRNA (guanine(527)-N(7))-methyltransferase RsmG [Serpentinimonas raichei]BAO82037.1 predicted S-adenosylmethionine-dependent methyltransferase involved in bacterial cell division [Serpentinimonas raichei]